MSAPKRTPGRDALRVALEQKGGPAQKSGGIVTNPQPPRSPVPPRDGMPVRATPPQKTGTPISLNSFLKLRGK